MTAATNITLPEITAHIIRVKDRIKQLSADTMIRQDKQLIADLKLVLQQWEIRREEYVHHKRD